MELFKRENTGTFTDTYSEALYSPVPYGKSDSFLPIMIPGGYPDHGNTGHLADVWHGAAGSGIDLYHMYLVVEHHILDIDHAYNVQAFSPAFRCTL